MEYIFGLELISLIKTVGYLGLFMIIFAESGFFMGFFFPGDSLLFTAGFLASQGLLNIWLLTIITFSAAILGDNFGYAFGRKVGPKIFKKEDSFLFHKDNILKAQKFYEKYGGKALIIARFVPIVRTFVPILAGVGKMRYQTFLTYNFIGGLIWAIGLTSLGFFLGGTVPNIDRYLVPIILVIILSSMMPTIIHILKDRGTRNEILKFLKRKNKTA